jgi:outer membrane protein TolC
VIRAYYGAVLAAERALTLATAERAARAHVAQAEALVRNGLATRSDALLAAIRAADVQAQRVEADAAVANARRELGVTLGRSDAGEAEVPATLPASERIRAVVSRDTASADESIRADVESAERGFDAARAQVDRARAALLPRVNSFARYDWYSAARPYAGDRTWTVGVMASWSLLPGASDLADLRSTNARADAARADADASQARARLDSERTRASLAVALTRLGIAERAVAQSAEAHRIVARKYEGGLATVVELLDAQAVEMHATLAFSEARYRAITAAAERRQAVGGDPATLAALDDDGSAPATDATPH